jgi:hypothetical protein
MQMRFRETRDENSEADEINVVFDVDDWFLETRNDSVSSIHLRPGPAGFAPCFRVRFA